MKEASYWITCTTTHPYEWNFFYACIIGLYRVL